MKLAISLFIAATLACLPVHAKSAALETRTILLVGEVNDSTAQKVIDGLVDLDAKSKDPIRLIINSPGGALSSGGRIIAAIKDTKAPITCVVDEKAYSMAAMILEFCGKRVVQDYADLLFHQASYSMDDQADHVVAEVEHYNKLMDVMQSDVAFRLKLTLPAYKEKVRGEWWLTAKEAVAVGAADETISGLKYKGKEEEKQLNLELPFYWLSLPILKR